MRITLLSLLFLCFVYISKAQQTLPSLNYVPQAPVTAAFTRYGDIPVDLSTGVTNISIPIYTLNERGFNIPISISYHASGIKVNDVASPVGLGWTLNAGGVITRTVMGLKDEQLDIIDGSGQHTFSKPPFRNDQQYEAYDAQREAQDPNIWFNEIFNQYLNNPPGFGMYDFYSDRFYYNLGSGESGVFRKDFMNDDFKTIPYSPMKIRFLNEFVRSYGFDIEMTTTNGIRYLFRGGKYAQWHPDKIINSSNTDVDTVGIKFLFPFVKVLDSSQLTLQVIYKNNTNKSVNMYKDLEEGDKGDRFFNIAIEMEKLVQKKYTPHSMRNYTNPFLFSMEDSLRHYDLPKKELLPYTSDTLKLDLLKVANSFMPGKYRFRANLRVKTIKDERVYNDVNGETEPPEDKIEYTVSRWYYFTIPKYISRVH